MSQKYQPEHGKKIRTYFDRAAVTFDTFYDKQRSRFMQWIDRRFRSDVFERYYRTFESLELQEKRTVLDIGCGSGPYVVEAAKRGARRVVGMDMSESMLDLARKRADAAGVKTKCEFTLGTFPQDASPEVFDHAIVMGVMDYVADPYDFLSALVRRVEISAMISFPSKHWFRTPFRKVRYWLKHCPVYFYDAKQIEQVCRQAGFSSVNIEKIGGAGMDYFVMAFK
jgi:cyclopropane fatty-acyl-phospholipid synthase-like methyltransferase